LLIEEKQEIKQWNEIFIVLHMLVFAFRYYSLVEKERDINIKDVVTGLYNERYFYNHFEVEEEKFIRFKSDMSLVLVELSNLSEINDKYGYEIGEKVLKEVAKVIKAQSRIIDMPARVDREVFAVLLSGTKELGAKALMTRVQMMLGGELEIEGKFVEVKIKSAYEQFQNYHSRESFYGEVMNKIKKQK
jgi:diguanylate cyclase (GGDEF)-like protein